MDGWMDMDGYGWMDGWMDGVSDVATSYLKGTTACAMKINELN
jgi:hypothetical protein